MTRLWRLPELHSALRTVFFILRQLTFKAARQLDPSLVEGSDVAEWAEIQVAVSRPQMGRARAVSST